MKLKELNPRSKRSKGLHGNGHACFIQGLTYHAFIVVLTSRILGAWFAQAVWTAMFLGLLVEASNHPSHRLRHSLTNDLYRPHGYKSPLILNLMPSWRSPWSRTIPRFFTILVLSGCLRQEHWLQLAWFLAHCLCFIIGVRFTWNLASRFVLLPLTIKAPEPFHSRLPFIWLLTASVKTLSANDWLELQTLVFSD